MRVSDLRPEVLAFAICMESMLRKHDEKKGAAGWKFADPVNLSAQTIQEARELRFEILGATIPSRERVFAEAGDVGNMAMMVADVCGALPLTEAVAEIVRVQTLSEQDEDQQKDTDGLLDSLYGKCEGTD